MPIRKMQPADITAVTKIDQESFSLPWPEGAFTAEVANPNARCWVLEEEGEVIGYIVIWLVLDEAHIATVAVEEAQRRKRFSELLLKTALQSAYAEGSRISYLEVRESNKAAISLYQKVGFEIAGMRKGYYKDNHENAILMTLTDFSHILGMP